MHHDGLPVHLPGDLADDEAYERAFRSLLWRLQPRGLQRRVARLTRVVRRLQDRGCRPGEARQRTFRSAASRVARQLAARGRANAAAAGASPRSGSAFRRLAPLLERELERQPFLSSPDFHCDAPLGGLARWLRGAGYDAAWWPDIDDDVLLHKALDSSAILLTTDRPLVRRAIVAYGIVPALLVPVSLTKRRQFAFVASRLELPRKPARCMQCGGRLEPVSKEAVRERIPPRTYPWLDEYYLCQRCHKLYWPGTHWEQIEQALSAAQT